MDNATLRLTPEAAALRAFTVMPLAEDDVQCLLSFKQAAQTLYGCDHQGDERVDYAETLILRWAGLSLAAHDEVSSAEPTIAEAAYDSSTLAYWLWSIEPRSGKSFCNGDEITRGFHCVAQLIDRLLLQSLGFAKSRPHLSTNEKFKAASAANPDASAEHLYAAAHRIGGSGNGVSVGPEQ